MKKSLLVLLLLVQSYVNFAQELPKKLLLVDLGTSIEKNTDGEGTDYYEMEKMFRYGGIVRYAVKFFRNTYGYLGVGFQYGKDTTVQIYPISNRLVPVQEKLIWKMPIASIGARQMIPVVDGRFYFQVDYGLNYGYSKLKGDLSYIVPSSNLNAILTSEGSREFLQLGLVPGVTFLFNKGVALQLSAGFIGYSSSRFELVYTDSFEESVKTSRINFDFSASTIRFGLGWYFQ